MAILLGLAACTDIRETEPDRTATEQLLISTAADNAVEQFDFTSLAGQAVFLRRDYFESYDSGYVLALTRRKLGRDGVRIVDAPEDAAFIVELRSGALSLNNELFYIGVGGFTIPVPLSDSIEVPRATLYGDYDRTGIAKFGALVFTADGTLHRDLETVYGLSWMDHNSILGIGWNEQNILPDSITDNPRPE